MNGYKGLDALAELCGASRSDQSQAEEAAARSNITAEAKTSNAQSPKAPQQPIFPKATTQSTVPQLNVTQQPWQQAMAAGANLGGGANPANSAASQTLALLQAAGLQTGAVTDPVSMNVIQQMTYLQYLQFAQAAALQAQMSGAANVPEVTSNATNVPLLFTVQTPQLATQTGEYFEISRASGAKKTASCPSSSWPKFLARGRTGSICFDISFVDVTLT